MSNHPISKVFTTMTFLVDRVLRNIKISYFGFNFIRRSTLYHYTYCLHYKIFIIHKFLLTYHKFFPLPFTIFFCSWFLLEICPIVLIIWWEVQELFLKIGLWIRIIRPQQPHPCHLCPWRWGQHGLLHHSGNFTLSSGICHQNKFRGFP